MTVTDAAIILGLFWTLHAVELVSNDHMHLIMNLYIKARADAQYADYDDYH